MYLNSTVKTQLHNSCTSLINNLMLAKFLMSASDRLVYKLLLLISVGPYMSLLFAAVRDVTAMAVLRASFDV